MEEGIGLNEVKDKEGGVGHPVSLNKKEKKRYPLASLGLFFVYTQNKVIRLFTSSPRFLTVPGSPYIHFGSSQLFVDIARFSRKSPHLFRYGSKNFYTPPLQKFTGFTSKLGKKL